MADQITIQRLNGGVLCPSATWTNRTRVKNNFTQITTLTGSGSAFALNNELLKLQGVMTKYGVYQNHTVVEGSPGIYDQITISFQGLLNPPQYVYDFNAPTKSYPLGKHPKYRTYWDHDIVDTGGGSDPTSIDAIDLDTWQAKTEATPISGAPNGVAWIKNNGAKPSKGAVCVTSASSTDLVSGWKYCSAKKPGVNSFIFPAIAVRETIYFTEERDFTFTVGPATFTSPNLNTRTVASMAGKAGWPLKTTFGYPKDVYTLLNDSTYSNYLNVGVDKNGTVTTLQESFYKERSIPITDYISTADTGGTGYYGTTTFGHPLWVCTSCQMKKVGYWFEATLQWEYYGMGVDADLYPLATARVQGLA